MLKVQVGERIKELRIQKRCLGQEAFAKELGWDKSYLCRVESGKQNITLETLAQICNALGVTVEDFFSSLPKQ